MAATKRNIVQQTEDVPELQPEQWTCLAALLEGLTDEAAGARAGVSRATVLRWKQEPAFAVTLTNERAALWRANMDALRGLLGKSVAVLSAALDSEDERLRVTAALKLLGSAGDAWGTIVPNGPTSVAAYERDRLFANLL